MRFKKIISALLAISMLTASASFNTFAEDLIDDGSVEIVSADDEQTTDEQTTDEPAVEEVLVDATVMAGNSQAETYVYEYDGSPLPVTVERSAFVEADAHAEAAVLVDLPGVTYGETTVGELLQLYSGVDYSSVVYTSCSDSRIDLNDVKVMSFIQVGASKTEYDSYINVKSKIIDFAALGLNEDWVVHRTGYAAYMEQEDRKKYGLKADDIFFLNPGANIKPYYDFELKNDQVYYLNKNGDCSYYTRMVYSADELGFDTYGEFINNYSGIRTINKDKISISVDNALNNTFSPAFILEMHTTDGLYFSHYTFGNMDLINVKSFKVGDRIISGEDMRNAVIDNFCVDLNVGTYEDLPNETIYLLGKRVVWFIGDNRNVICRPYIGADSYILALDGEEYSYDTLNNGLPVMDILEAKGIESGRFDFTVYAVVGSDRIDILDGILSFGGNTPVSWDANYKYDPVTDTLTWDNYPFTISGTPEPWTSYGSYDVYYDDVELIYFGWSFIDNDGKPTIPSVNPILETARLNVLDGRNIPANATFKAAANVGSNHVASNDSIIIPNSINEYNPELAKPVIESLTRTLDGTTVIFNVKMNKPDNILGYILTFETPSGTSSTSTNSDQASRYIFSDWATGALPNADSCTVTVYAVDKNGNYSSPATKSYNPEKWVANYVYDPSSDELTWDDYPTEDKVDPDPWEAHCEYSVWFNESGRWCYASSQYDENGDKTRPKVYPTLWLTNLSIFEGADYSGNVAIRASVMNGCSAEDCYVFDYKGGSLNNELAAPTISSIVKDGTTLYVNFENDNDVIGYVYEYEYCGYRDNGVSWNNVVSIWYVDDVIRYPVGLTLYAVDKNGNYSLPTAVKYDPITDTILPADSNAGNVWMEGTTFRWKADSKADHYLVTASNGRRSVTDYCFANDSANLITMMNAGDFESGTYELTISSVQPNGTETALYTYTFTFKYTGADEDDSIDKDGNTFTYVENADGTLKITGGNINNPDVIIPGKIDGKTVTAIADNAFAFNYRIKTLRFEEGVKRLGWYAFNTCEELESVILPSSLEKISSWAFERCYALTEITIPENVSVIEGGAFAQNSSMTAINVDKNNKNYTSINGILFSKNEKVLVSYPAGKSGAYTVPSSVDHIEDAAFYGARKLTEINILGSLDYIGFEAFAECESLKSITINEGVTYVGYWAFRNCNKIKNIYVPTSVENIGDRAFGFADYGDELIQGFTLEGYVDSSIYFYAKRHGIPFKSRGVDYSIESPYVEDNKTTAEIAASSTATEKEKEEQITQISATAPINLMAKDESGRVLASGDDIKIKGKNIEHAATINNIKTALDIKDDKPVSLIDIELWAGNEDISDKFDGLVKVEFEIPAAFKKTEVCCHRIVVDEKGNITKELIPGERHGNKYTVYLEHFSTYSLTEDETVEGVTVSGTIKSMNGNARAASDVKMELLDSDGSIMYTTEGSDSYSFSNVASGTYTLRVSKSKHCAREYEITVGSDAVEQDVEIQLYGDINNDGNINILDALEIINYANKSGSMINASSANEDYLICVSDINGDKNSNIIDALEIMNYANKTGSIIDNIK